MRTWRASEARSHSRNAAELGLWPRIPVFSEHTHTLPTVPVPGDEVESSAGHPTEHSPGLSGAYFPKDPVCKLNCLGITNLSWKALLSDLYTAFVGLYLQTLS